MRLIDYLQLSESEHRLLSAIMALHQQQPKGYEKLIFKALSSVQSADTLVRFAEDGKYGKIIKKYFARPDMDRLFERLLKKSLEGQTYQPKPHPTLNWSKLYIGHILFQLGYESVGDENEETRNEYLFKALDYGSFHASHFLVLQYSEKLRTLASQNKTVQFVKTYEQALAITLRGTSIHGTPALINLALLTNVKDAAPHLTAEQRQAAQQLMASIVRAAGVVEKQSQGSIDNAYFGAGIQASNSLGFTSIPSAIERLDRDGHQSNPQLVQNLSQTFLNNYTRRPESPADYTPEIAGDLNRSLGMSTDEIDENEMPEENGQGNPYTFH